MNKFTKVCFRYNLIFKEEKTAKLHDKITGQKSIDQIFISNHASSIQMNDQEKRVKK